MPSHDPSTTPPSSGAKTPPKEQSILIDLAKPEQPNVPTTFSPNTGKNIGIATLFVVVTLAGSFFVVQHFRSRRTAELDTATASSAEALPVVDVASVRPAAATQMLKLPGETGAWHETTIYARVSGYVASWKADIGDKVAKDQLLATIDTPDLDDQLAAAQAKLKVSESEVAVAESSSNFAKTTYDRWRDSGKGVVSDQERDEKKAEYESSVAKLNAAKSQVNLDQAEVDQLNALSQFKEVRAPFDGVITGRRIDIGDLVTAGSTSSTTSLYSIAQFNQMRVFVNVPHDASAKMILDTPATVTSDEYPDQEFAGTIERTSNAIDPASSTLRVEVDVPNPSLTLVPGMPVEVLFNLKQQPVLEVPASALIIRSSGPEMAVVKNGMVSFHKVDIAREQSDMVEIRSGLALNDQVALNLSSQIAEGDHVTVNNMDSTITPNPPPAKEAVAVLAHAE
jgi:RND family efflux transporter MFP subunit